MTAISSQYLDRDRQLRRAFLRAVSISLLAHVGGLLAVVFASHYTYRPPLEERSMPVTFLPGKGEKVRKGNLPPASKPAPASLPSKKTLEKEKKETPKPEEKPETKEISATKEKTEEKKSESEKKETPSKAEESKTSEPQAGATSSGNLVGSTGPSAGGTVGVPDGSTAFDAAMAGITGDPELAAYYNQVATDLNQAWRPPPTVPPDPDLYVDVIVVVNKKGEVLEYNITHLSGNQALDRSVKTLMEGLKKGAIKITAPPAKLKGNHLELPLRFRPVAEN